MTLGDKIRKYRSLKSMTQKELGQEVGFSGATADSRIRKYEKNLMAPKEDIRFRLAKALDVDLSALSDIDIQTPEDIMQILFLFEEEIGLEVERTDKTTSLVFNNDNPNYSVLMSYLYAWYIQKKNLPHDETNTNININNQYKKWKARFPRDLSSYWDEQYKAIVNTYNPQIEAQKNSCKKITKLSEFLLHMRILIKSNLTIKLDTKTYGVGDNALRITFTVSELLNTDAPEKQEAFTTFLCDLDNLNEYGMPYYTEMSSDETGTKVSYVLRLSSLPSYETTIKKMIEHEAIRHTLSDFEIATFEKALAYELKEYDLDLKEEIEFYKK